MRAASFCIGAMGLLLFLLALNVSRQRRMNKISAGMPDDPSHPLYKAVVAHRNASEFIPMFAILMVACQLYGTPNWMVAVYGAAVCSRFLHAFSILSYTTMKRPNLFRVLGAGLTYLSGAIMSGALLTQAIMQTPTPGR
jgi:uncharacterized membrane protein YecN with MAPEG domain